MLGANNDHNVLAWSHIFEDLLHGRSPLINFEVNGNQYNIRYYLQKTFTERWVVTRVIQSDSAKARGLWVLSGTKGDLGRGYKRTKKNRGHGEDTRERKMGMH